MKVGGKILAYFESCSSPVDKEGILSKKVNHTQVPEYASYYI